MKKRKKIKDEESIPKQTGKVWAFDTETGEVHVKKEDELNDGDINIQKLVDEASF